MTDMPIKIAEIYHFWFFCLSLQSGDILYVFKQLLVCICSLSIEKLEVMYV